MERERGWRGEIDRTREREREREDSIPKSYNFILRYRAVKPAVNMDNVIVNGK